LYFSVIVAIVLQIFNRWRRYFPGYDLPRILLTAPSNAAVDEIAKRLSHEAKDFCVMRIGRRSEVRPDVQSIFIDDVSVGSHRRLVKIVRVDVFVAVGRTRAVSASEQ
jgi:hypothetical protein